MTTMRSASERTSSNSSETSRMPRPASRSATSRRCTNSMAPTSRPRVGWAATSTRGLHAISRAMTHFCWLPPDSDVASEAGPPPRTSYSLMRSLARSRMRPSRSMPCRDILGVLYSRSARFSARVKFRTRPRRWRSSAMCETPWRTMPRAPALVSSLPSTAIEPESTVLRPVMASTSSDWPLPSTPARATISPAWTVGVAPLTAGRARARGDRRQVAVVARPQIADLEHRLLGLRRRLVDAQQDLAADHEPRERLLGGALGGNRVDALAAPQHGDAVGDLEDLVELVRDEDDAGAVLLQRLEDAEEVARLLGGEHRGRLVEDEDPRPAEERAQDLHALLHADADILDARVGVHGEAVAVRQLAHARRGRVEVEQQALARLVGQDDVLGHRHDGDEHEVLVHHADPVLDGLQRRADADGPAVDADLALVGLVQPVEDAHQRRLAGAVLPEQRVDLAGLQVEVDRVVRDDRPEALRDPAQLEGVLHTYLTVSGMLAIVPLAMSSWTFLTWSAYFEAAVLSLP